MTLLQDPLADQPVWTPSQAAAERTQMAGFMRACAARHDFPAAYAHLYAWSVASPAEFWAEFVAFCAVRFTAPPQHVFLPDESIRGGVWFAGAELNFAEQLLRHQGEEPALIFRDERGRRIELSRAELRDRVLAAAGGLRALGVRPGDRVAAVLPNCPEAVITMLASAAIGAVFSSCSPDFGVRAIVDRFAQIQPRVLVGCDGYSYGGKRIDCRAGLAAAAEAIGSLEALLVVPFLDEAPDWSVLPAARSFAWLYTAGEPASFLPLPFDQPLFVMYSSGTTGKPKCIVHGAGGTLLQHLKEHSLHADLRAGERLLYFTTCGWMMWNWLVSSLATGATIVLYDGSPLYPDHAALWQLVAEEQVTVFGTSPGYLTAVEKSGASPGAEADLRRLRMILSTGAPLTADSYDFVARRVGSPVQLCSISGGTDLISCFVLGNPLLPVYRGEIQGAGLGMAVDVFDSHGNSVRDAMGELVCTQPFPSMPLSFWNDPDDELYRSTYFARFPGAWCQGDLAAWTARGGMIIYGRSDATLNPGGVRIGTAEVCVPALSVAEIQDAMAVGHRVAGEERIVLFVVVRAGAELDAELRARVAAAIRESASPRHVPARILAVPEIPRTVSGKPVELAVRAIINHDSEPVTGALANPAALDFFRGIMDT